MQKWEYKAIRVGQNAWEDIDLLNSNLNVQENWELVSVDNGVAYFKRPFIEVIKADSPFQTMPIDWSKIR